MIEISEIVIVILLFGLGTCQAWLVLLALKTREPTQNSRYQTVTQFAPFAIWEETDGQVSWANVFCQNAFSDPSQPFLGIQEFKRRTEIETSQSGAIYHMKKPRDAAAESYSIQIQRLGPKTLFYAQDATLLTETESELKRFVQTLSSTFAHLPIGLAVFDRKRDLTLFNPALPSLLNLAPDWLAGRPSLRSFLDRLRNEGAIPEPKDFTTLRHEFAELESGAFTGKYEVDWALPSGSIYRVTGRPHPQGGAALLFEDISKGAALEAEYRAELRQLYSALEALSDAVAIFDSAGELAYANDAFDEMWDCSLSSAVAPVTVNDVSRLFQKHCKPTPVWGEFRNFVHDLSERSQWRATASMNTGQPLYMKFSPIADGRVLCEFRHRSRKSEGPKLVRHG